MKCYSRVLGGRDYSLFETLHFGLRLPGTLSSFGDVVPITVSNWAPLKRGKAYRMTKKDETITYNTKIEIFDDRTNLARPKYISERSPQPVLL